jgi:SAM-dependent methyltransferase
MDRDFTNAGHWDSREGRVKPRPPSRLNVSVRDISDLLARNFKPGDKVFEAGCAPGKYLLWCAMVKQARVAGVEYAPDSYQQTKALFHETGVEIDLRPDDFFNHSFPLASFDMVYSFGLIEHFEGERLREIVRHHVDLLKPGGKAIVIIPNYSGWYGSVLGYFDRANLETHNLDVMSVQALEKLAPAGTIATAYRYGKLTPWILSYGVPRGTLGKLGMYAANFAGLWQPFNVEALCPWLVLEITTAQ